MTSPGFAGKRLAATELPPAAVFDSGSGVADTSGILATEHPAVTYRNMEEIFPTRRIAAGSTASPLVPDAVLAAVK